MLVLDRFALAGRTAVVINSTRDPGRAFARALAKAGANVVIVGPDAAAALRWRQNSPELRVRRS